MKKRATLFVLALLCNLPPALFGYGREGHQAIGELARQQITPATRAAVKHLLGTDELSQVATWLDDVRAAERRQGPLAHDAATLDFLRRFPRSREWHFVNLPLGSAGYDPQSPFTNADDVVHGLALAIDTLEGKDTGLAAGEALKVLVHLVGDVHQPLHTVTGYYDLTNPAAPRLLSAGEATINSPQDAGGNALFFTKSRELHALWDSELLVHFSPGRNYLSLAADCLRTFRDVRGHGALPGDYHGWPTQWATESVRLGTQAYAGVTFGPAQVSRGAGRALKLHKIQVTLEPGYEAAAAPVDARQVALAGARLAALLNSLHWAN